MGKIILVLIFIFICFVIFCNCMKYSMEYGKEINRSRELIFKFFENRKDKTISLIDFNNLENVIILQSNNIKISLDLVNFRLNIYKNDVLIKYESYINLKEMNDSLIQNLNLDNLYLKIEDAILFNEYNKKSIDIDEFEIVKKYFKEEKEFIKILFHIFKAKRHGKFSIRIKINSLNNLNKLKKIMRKNNFYLKGERIYEIIWSHKEQVRMEWKNINKNIKKYKKEDSLEIIMNIYFKENLIHLKRKGYILKKNEEKYSYIIK